MVTKNIFELSNCLALLFGSGWQIIPQCYTGKANTFLHKISPWPWNLKVNFVTWQIMTLNMYAIYSL